MLFSVFVQDLNACCLPDPGRTSGLDPLFIPLQIDMPEAGTLALPKHANDFDTDTDCCDFRLFDPESGIAYIRDGKLQKPTRYVEEHDFLSSGSGSISIY